jgi:hypothetical protein
MTTTNGFTLNNPTLAQMKAILAVKNNTPMLQGFGITTLKSLERLGLIAHMESGSGWILTEDGQTHATLIEKWG